jgi:hypothetical protein
MWCKDLLRLQWRQCLGHVHILCITVQENRIICCQIFCDLLLKSAFEWIFNVMQLILVEIQRICTWPKIWTLSGRLSLMRNVQLMKTKNIYIPCVPHKNNCKKKIGSHDMKQTDSSIIIVRNVCVLTSASMIVYLFFTRSWSAIIGEFKSWVTCISFALLYRTTELSALRYFTICS